MNYTQTHVDMDQKKNKLLDNIGGLKERQQDKEIVGLSYKKIGDEGEELEVGVRGANRVSGLAQQLTQQLETSWGMTKPAKDSTDSKPVSIEGIILT